MTKLGALPTLKVAKMAVTLWRLGAAVLDGVSSALALPLNHRTEELAGHRSWERHGAHCRDALSSPSNPRPWGLGVPGRRQVKAP